MTPLRTEETFGRKCGTVGRPCHNIELAYFSGSAGFLWKAAAGACERGKVGTPLTSAGHVGLAGR